MLPGSHNSFDSAEIEVLTLIIDKEIDSSNTYGEYVIVRGLIGVRLWRVSVNH